MATRKEIVKLPAARRVAAAPAGKRAARAIKPAAGEAKAGAGRALGRLHDEWSAFRARYAKESPSGRIRMIRAGTRATHLAGAAQALKVPREIIYGLVGIPASTANRKIAKKEDLDAAATERLARLAQMEQMAEDTFGDAATAASWLREENIALGGASPLSLLDTDVGSREVAKVLTAIAYGGAA